MRKQLVTIKDNPSIPHKDDMVKEISFFDSEGKYYGMLMRISMYRDQPTVNLYCIDEGIKIYVSEERET